ncbi:MarR family winged helix-turn-helix transcriptional regulator [Alteribacillus iranensis]|uniref:DNA-binding transcriptional regulator, MarR family n=1 Tax=Alteribacillus iranensis TaxID=930128 RepID=A0A1I2C216_9BACI|nr:MarR family transcriptional regulator [Alteribacillus iranensis]SFE62421.1 DNA-binding transcriptional regulator, MarR family [Alteribacillus iranensis]
MDRSYLFHALNQKVRQLKKELDDKLQVHDLYYAQWTILYTLSRKGSITQTELWKYLQVEAPTITRTLTRMEEKGWIVRTPGRDKRERLVALTEEALAKLPRIKETIDDTEQQFVTSLSEEEQQKLYHLLEKLGTSKE